jgi:DnaJ-class molecular chaperone
MESLIFLIIVGIIVYGVVMYVKKNNQREGIKRRQEEKELRERKEEEERKRKEEEDKKYNWIINCPTCEGTGIARLMIKNHVCPDSSRFVHICLASKSDEAGTIDYDGAQEFEEREIEEDTCPDCNGKGIAYAWFGTEASYYQKCSKCEGSGKLTVRKKLEIGVGEEQIDCYECSGTGKIYIPEKEIVHVKTITSFKGKLYTNDAERYYISIDYTAADAERYIREHKYILLTPREFTFELTDENRRFFSKSKSRFSA